MSDLKLNTNHELNLNEMLDGLHVVRLEEPVVYKAGSAVGLFDDMVLPFAIENRFKERDPAKQSPELCWEHCAPRQYDKNIDVSMWLLCKLYPHDKFTVSLAWDRRRYRATISFGERLMLNNGIAPTGPRALAKALYYRLKEDHKL